MASSKKRLEPKPFNPDEDEVVEITSETKEHLSKKEMFNRKEVEMNSHYFTLLHIEHVCNETGVSQQNILLLLYLRELNVFPYSIKVINTNYALHDLISIGCVVKIFERDGSKSLYKLTEFGEDVIDAYLESFKKPERFLTGERVDNDSKRYLKSVLDSYFD